jgi:pre-mRNA-splicing factor 38B
LDQKQARRKQNIKAYENGKFAVGTKVRAIYSDEENEPAWYEAIIEAADENEWNKFWIKFPEYGNSECVDLGDMELLSDETGSSKRSGDDRDDSNRNRSSRSRSRDQRSRDKRSPSSGREDPENLMKKVLASSREASAAVGKNYGQRPASYKGSLSLKMDRYTARKRSPSKSPDRRERYRERDRDSYRNKDRDREDFHDRRKEDRGAYTQTSSIHSSNSNATSREQQERLKKLKERYGDASAK